MATVKQVEGNPAITTLANGDDYVVQFGNQTFTSNTDLSAVVTTGLNSAVWMPTANVSFTADKPLVVDIDAGSAPVAINSQPGGSHYYTPKGNNNVWTRYKLLGGCFVRAIGGGTTTNHEQRSGRGQFSRSNVCTNAWIDGGSFLAEYNATAITAAICSGGSSTIQRAVTTLTVAGGGTQVRVGQGEVGDAVPTATTVNVFGGTLVWAGGDITTLNGFGDGMIDFSQISQNITVTTANVAGRFRERSVWKSPAGFTVTITNQNVKASDSETIPV
jgi:hypothetical protein